MCSLLRRLNCILQVFHISRKIYIICQKFRIISKKISVYGFSMSTLQTLIERHNEVISFSDNIEKLFSFIVLMQVVWNILVICYFVFIITVVSISANFC
jgi:hypothetical protein